MKNAILMIALLATTIFLAACSDALTESSAATPAPTVAQEEPVQEQAAEDAAAPKDETMVDEMMDDETMDDAEAEAAEGEMMESEAEPAAEADQTAAMVDLAPWQTLSLTDARSGEAFTFADFAGKTVFVEPMATWCGNCKRQLGNVKEANAQINGDDVVFVALSVETNIPAETLAGYADDAGFDWTFAVMTPEMLQALSDAFGQTISNPPATPHFIILPDGSTTELVTGIEPAADLIAQIEATRG